MHLGVAMQQLAEIHHAWSQGSEQDSFYTAQISLSFLDLCHLSPQATMRVKQQFTQMAQAYDVVAQQQGRKVALGRFVMHSFSSLPSLDKNSPNPANPALLQQSLQTRPVAASRVNKHNPANVLLGDPVDAQEENGSSKFGAWLVDRTTHSFFNEAPARPINIFVFAEAARQLLRLFGPDGQPEQTGNQPLGSSQGVTRVELLNKIEVSLIRPLYWTDRVYLDLQARNILQVGDATRLQYEGQFVVNGVSAGQFVCEAMSLSAELQRQWASQTKDALIVGAR